MAGGQMNQFRKARVEKSERLRALGVDPFGSICEVTHSVAAARALAPEPQEDAQPKGEVVTCAGRVGNIRKAGGKLRFSTLYDRSRGDVYADQAHAGVEELDDPAQKKQRGIQLYFEKTQLGEEQFEIVKCLDLSDWIAVTGPVGRTKTGEISIFAESVQVLGKSMLPPPQQAGASSGVLSPEMRQRKRYLDLMMNDAALSTFMQRSRIINSVRQFFTQRDFLEVETPMMHEVLGGAAARPFVTHFNALGEDRYLRIAPELHLKRLIVGGLERVFEINRNFRNEGLSPRHNPEFTMIEWYQAYANHHYLMDLTEELFRHVADDVLGGRVLQFGDIRIDLDKPFKRISYHDALEEFAGIAYDDKEKVTAKAVELGLNPKKYASYDRLANEVWEELVEEHLIQPTFITDQPTWLTPLCRTWPDNPEKTMRFELFAARMEIGNAYSELNDPDLQRQRFNEQLAEATEAKDDEAGIDGEIDDDYCEALDHGLPVCGGQGIGIDRLVMLFTNQQNIRDVILFPAMKSDKPQAGETVAAKVSEKA